MSETVIILLIIIAIVIWFHQRAEKKTIKIKYSDFISEFDNLLEDLNKRLDREQNRKEEYPDKEVLIQLHDEVMHYNIALSKVRIAHFNQFEFDWGAQLYGVVRLTKGSDTQLKHNENLSEIILKYRKLLTDINSILRDRYDIEMYI